MAMVVGTWPRGHVHILEVYPTNPSYPITAPVPALYHNIPAKWCPEHILAAATNADAACVSDACGWMSLSADGKCDGMGYGGKAHRQTRQERERSSSSNVRTRPGP